MRKFSRPLGFAGLLLVVAGLIGFGMARQFLGFYVIPWALAAVCLLTYAAYNWQDVKNFGTSRTARYGAGSALGVILVLGIVILLAVMTDKHTLRWDLTEGQRHSLAPQTIKVLENLSNDINVTGFFTSEGVQYEQARSLFDLYAKVSPKFKYELVDPVRQPGLARAAGITKADTTVVTAGDNSEKISELSEERLTNAVLRLTRTSKKTVYFITGHGERELDDQGENGYSRIKQELSDQNYDVKPLLLMQESDIPKDASLLVLAGPQKDYLPEELDAIGRYLRQGGRVLILIDPEAAPNIVAFLKDFNVKVGDDVIVDKMSRLFGADYLMPLAAQYAKHPVTKDFTVASFFPVARSVTVAGEKKDGVSTVPLVYTSDQAFAETDFETLKQGKAGYEEGQDLAGPVSLAVVGTIDPLKDEKEAGETPETRKGQPKKKDQGKFIVFGDSDFASNKFKALQGNGDLFMSSVNWLAEEADLVAIRPKAREFKPLMLDQLQMTLMFWVPVVIMPLGVLIVGIAVLTSRRKRQ
jgi:ABC-type uncharacterized transport system involved in gliding motility auxiliary subunit